MKKVLFSILFVSVAAICDAQTVLHFSQKYGYPMIDGEVNGKFGWFLLDTGTPLDFILNNNYLQIENNRQRGMGRLASGQQFMLCKGDSTCSFTVDDVEFMGIATNNGDLHFMEDITQTPQFLGFIGYGYLKNYKFALDYKQGTCTLYPLDSIPDIDTEKHPLLTTINFTYDEKRPQIPVTHGSIGDIPVTITFDTGASTGWVTINQKTNSVLTASRNLSADMWGTYKLKNLYVGSLDSPTLKGLHYSISNSNNHIILSGEFLRHYITVWNYSSHTIEIYRNDSFLFGLFPF